MDTDPRQTDRRWADDVVAGAAPRGCGASTCLRNPRGRRRLRVVALMAGGIATLAGCAPDQAATRPAATSRPATRPADTTAARAIQPRDALERMALERGADLRFIDRLMDERTRVPPYDRPPPPDHPEGLTIARGVPLAHDAAIFADREPLESKQATVRLGLARSTIRTREAHEALSAVLPLFDLEQRDVNVRAEAKVYEKPEECYFGLLDGTEQMVISHVFDYLLARNWMAAHEGNGTVLLGYALPANPRSTPLDQDRPGLPGTSIELIVTGRAAYRQFADLKGARLALAVNYTHAPGAFLTRLLLDAGHPADAAFFGSVTLRRYPKDCVIDVLKGKADVACVDQGTMGAIERFYGTGTESDGSPLRVLAVSPRYNMDVLYTSLNNLQTHRTEIELTQRQLTTLRRDPEGQEVLFFFDQHGWRYAEEGCVAVAEAAFADFLTFYERTPRDLKPLLDDAAPVDRRTYDRAGDE